MAEHQFQTELLPLDGIVPNERNPQRGDIGAIMTAIAVDGWHGAVICERRRGKPRIIAGEHRWRGLVELNEVGFTFPDGTHKSYAELVATKGLLMPPPGQIPVQVLSVDELRAMRKLVADNQASKLAMTDDEAMAAILRSFAEDDNLLGTLFDGDDLDELLRSLDADFNMGNIADGRTPAERANEYLDSAIRSLILPLPKDDYESVVRELDEIGKARSLDSHTQIVVALVHDAAAALTPVE